MYGEEPQNGPSKYLLRFFYETFFYIIIVVILLSVVAGIIIDTFAELREDYHHKENDKLNQKLKSLSFSSLISLSSPFSCNS